ncbi:MAG: hypothetical protein KKH44_08575 [Bacteroidetes bacterium]|nr:hypothetical protein [Bacteroidota bacterium]
MKKTLQNTLKVGAAIALILSAGAVSAQQKVSGGAAGSATVDIAKKNNATPGQLNGSVRVIDNKGTIKYLQSKNGITMLTNTTTDATTTTWQLGGELTDDTYIDVKGKAFALDGIELISAATVSPSTNAKTLTVHGAADAGTGYTFLVRDEATGAVKKLVATDLITSGQTYFTATADQKLYVVTAGAAVPAISGAQVPLPNFSKVWVFRNGAKLVAGLDYTTAASTVTLITVPATATSTNDWTVNAGDIIEVQYYK